MFCLSTRSPLSSGDASRQDVLAFVLLFYHAAMAPAPVSLFSKLCRKFASRSRRGPLILHGSSSPSIGRMGTWSASSVSQLYMYQQKTNSGSRMATCAEAHQNCHCISVLCSFSHSLPSPKRAWTCHHIPQEMTIQGAGITNIIC